MASLSTCHLELVVCDGNLVKSTDHLSEDSVDSLVEIHHVALQSMRIGWFQKDDAWITGDGNTLMSEYTN